MVNSSKIGEIPLCSPDVSNKEIEKYNYACWGEPEEGTRPSMQQHTAILELLSHGSCYVDLGLFHPITSERIGLTDGRV